jgi:glycosyltransferase involved in cell wall biosynthesis
MNPAFALDSGKDKPTVLWWGRFDPGYSRNRILRKLLAELGWQVKDFHPLFARAGDWEARLRRLPRPDLVWVPCFRQHDLAAASRWAKSHGVPLIFDPLISAYDKKVDERGKLKAGSLRAKRLLRWERALFQRASRVLADTPAHADYFTEVLGVPRERLAVVYVGAEEALFKPEPPASTARGEALDILFYGSFIPLQAPQVVVEAARLYRGPPVKWVLLGQGPLRKLCEENARGLANVSFEDWLPYAELPGRIHRADILLGVFGATPKAGRVIPNKVFQSLACGRAVVTRSANAYPESLIAAEDSGLVWTSAGDAQSLADRVASLAADSGMRHRLDQAAAKTSQRWFSESVVRLQLNAALQLPPA